MASEKLTSAALAGRAWKFDRLVVVGSEITALDNIMRRFDTIANIVDPLCIDAELIDAIVELEAVLVEEARR